MIFPYLLRSKKNALTLLNGDGDFRSEECVNILKDADIVVTNPPFSLFREYVAQLVEYGKQFLIIGNINAITYKEIFPLIKDNKLWLGYSIHSGDREFRVPDDYPLEAAGYRIDEQGRKYIRVNSILHQFPLNVMYWSENDDGTYEMLDGQQRTISICDWLDNGYSIFANPASPLTPYYAHTSQEITDRVLDYKLMIYICKGTDTEKLDWFKIINIAGEKLSDQELRNAIYTGHWLSDAKRYFSKNQCIAYRIGERYMSGTPIRQDYLQTVLFWIASKEGKTIEQYMAEHQRDTHATPLKQYFKTVIDWVELTFPNYRSKLMKGLDWGLLYNQYSENIYDPNQLEADIKQLLTDDDVTKQKGVYEYLLSGKTKEKALSIRAFSDNEKRTLYERQAGICPMCAAEGVTKKWAIEEMHADHIIPWSKGGHTTLDNGQMLCRDHNLAKGSK